MSNESTSSMPYLLCQISLYIISYLLGWCVYIIISGFEIYEELFTLEEIVENKRREVARLAEMQALEAIDFATTAYENAKKTHEKAKQLEQSAFLVMQDANNALQQAKASAITVDNLSKKYNAKTQRVNNISFTSLFGRLVINKMSL